MMDRFSPTERIGVNKIEQIFLSEFEWIPRQIFQSDVGIDMEVEICENRNPTGQLLGVQIKSGESYFKENHLGDIIYRGSKTHLDYWLNHSLPIIIVLHNPKTNQTFWQKIEEKNISLTAKGWKTEIPLSQSLEKESIDTIKKVNKYPLYYQRLQRLMVNKSLMTSILNGDEIIIEIERWINKSIGRATVKIKKIVGWNNEKLLSEAGYIHFNEIADLQRLYPWADFKIDESFYEEDDEDNFMATYGIWDPEDKYYIGSTVDKNEYLANLPGIRPIECGSGEIHFYRLIMSLNELGVSFLKMNDFIENGVQLKLGI